LLQSSRGMMYDKTGHHFIAFKPGHGKTFEWFPMSGVFQTFSLIECGCEKYTDTLMNIEQ